MRIADNMNYNQVISSLNSNRSKASELQNQAATQKRITKPSDDPAGTARVLASRTDLTAFTQYEKSLYQAKSFLDFSEQALQELTELFLRVKEVTLGQVNEAGANPDTRRATAAEVEQLYQQAVQIANRKIGDRYLFGGFKTTVPPFDSKGGYKGDDGEMMIEINKSTYIPMNVPGSKVFHGKGFGIRTMLGADDGVVKTADEVRQVQAEAKIHPGQGEPVRDLDNKFPPGKEDRRPEIRGPAGKTVIEENREEQTRSSKSGGGLVENKSTRATEAQDGENIFSVLKAVHTGLATNDTDTLQSAIERIDEAHKQIVMARAQIGSRVTTMNATLDTIGRGTLDHKTLVSQVEDINAFELFNDMTKNENTLKATLESSGRLIKPSLLDFLR